MRSSWASDSEIKLILTALMPLNRLAVQLSLSTGLRIGDVLSLTRAQVAKGRVRVYERKTGKSKQIRVPARLQREALDIGGDPYIFPHRLDAKRHRTRQAVYRDVVRAVKAFRLSSNITPHSARKVYAVHQFDRTGDLKAVQRLLNHDRDSTTAIYVLSRETPVKRRRRHKKAS